MDMKDVERLFKIEDAQRLPDLYSSETVSRDKKVVQLKWFTPRGRGTWLAIEGEAVLDHGHRLSLRSVVDWRCVRDVLFFGWVVSPLGEDLDELGYFSLSEFLELPPLLLGRDIYFRPRELGLILGGHV